MESTKVIEKKNLIDGDSDIQVIVDSTDTDEVVVKTTKTGMQYAKI